MTKNGLFSTNVHEQKCEVSEYSERERNNGWIQRKNICLQKKARLIFHSIYTGFVP